MFYLIDANKPKKLQNEEIQLTNYFTSYVIGFDYPEVFGFTKIAFKS